MIQTKSTMMVYIYQSIKTKRKFIMLHSTAELKIKIQKLAISKCLIWILTLQNTTNRKSLRK